MSNDPVPATELTLARAYEILGLEPLDNHLAATGGRGSTTWMSVYAALGVMRGSAVMIVMANMDMARSRESYLRGIIETLGEHTQPKVKRLARPVAERERKFTTYSSGGRLFVRSERTYRSALQERGVPKGIILFKDIDWARKAQERLGEPDKRVRYLVPRSLNPKVYQARDETWCPVMLVNEKAAREMLGNDPKIGIVDQIPTALTHFAANW